MAKKKKKSMKEQPFKPEVDTGIEKPVRGMLAVGDVNDKYSTYPSNGLTPRRLARIFRAADGGDVFEQMELFEEMEEKDTHLFSQLQTENLLSLDLTGKFNRSVMMRETRRLRSLLMSS